MGALPVAPNVLRFDYFFTVGEDLAAKCHEFHRFTGGVPSSADLDTLAGTVRSAWGTNMSPRQTVDRILTEIEITDLTSPTSAQGISTGSTPGTNGGAGLPASICALQSIHIARRFRGGHTRVYWPIGAEGDRLDSQKWSTAAVAAFEAAWTAFHTDWSTDLPGSISTVTRVAVSYYVGNTVFIGPSGRARNISQKRAVPLIDNMIAQEFRQGIASQRKRLLRLA